METHRLQKRDVTDSTAMVNRHPLQAIGNLPTGLGSDRPWFRQALVPTVRGIATSAWNLNVESLELTSAGRIPEGAWTAEVNWGVLTGIFLQECSYRNALPDLGYGSDSSNIESPSFSKRG